MLVFDGAPGPGDSASWEDAFAREFGDEPRVRHRTFAWDNVDGVLGAAGEEFVARGYDLEKSVGLIAAPDQLILLNDTVLDLAVVHDSGRGADAVRPDQLLRIESDPFAFRWAP